MTGPTTVEQITGYTSVDAQGGEQAISRADLLKYFRYDADADAGHGLMVFDENYQARTNPGGNLDEQDAAAQQARFGHVGFNGTDAQRRVVAEPDETVPAGAAPIEPTTAENTPPSSAPALTPTDAPFAVHVDGGDAPPTHVAVPMAHLSRWQTFAEKVSRGEQIVEDDAIAFWHEIESVLHIGGTSRG